MKLSERVGSKEIQETVALLQVLALTNKDVERGKVRPVAEAFKRIREHIRD